MGGGRVEPQAFGPVGLRSGDAQSQAQTAASPSINPAIMLSGGKKECSDGMAEVHFIGQIEFGENFGTSWSNAGLLCEFVVETGDEWVPLSSQADDAVTQLTQVAHVGRGGFCMWSHPLDLYFGTSSVVGWPRLSLQIWAITQTSAKPTAYGTVYLPTSRGHHELICRTWSPAGAYSAELAESYFNKKSYLPTPEAPNSTTRPMDTSIYQTFYEDEETRAKLTTMTSGSVHISLDVITKHFSDNGIHLSPNERPHNTNAMSASVNNNMVEATATYKGQKSSKTSLATAFNSTAASQKLVSRISRPQTPSGAAARAKSGGAVAEPITPAASTMPQRRLGGATVHADRDDNFRTAPSEHGESSSSTTDGGWWSNVALKEAVLRQHLVTETPALSGDRRQPEPVAPPPPQWRGGDGHTNYPGPAAVTGGLAMRPPHGVDTDRNLRNTAFAEDVVEEFLDLPGGALDGDREVDIGRSKQREVIPRGLAAQQLPNHEKVVVQRREGEEPRSASSSLMRSTDPFGSSNGLRATGVHGDRQSPTMDEERNVMMGSAQPPRSDGRQPRQLPTINSAWRQGTEGS
eukprot:GHVS01028252.1.p1 GENE.GHVS01028252.1~~GHVS01028252.1.p1  ORF type:complete len:576 (-),score=79.32 GHVS01028252.1:942-2669(-)